MKACPKCDRRLPVDAFGFRDAARTRLQSYCRDCQRLAWRQWYGKEENGERHRLLVSRRRKRRIARHRAIIMAAKAVPCADCGISYPHYVMDFDHVEDKRTEVSRIVYLQGTVALLDEIGKCEVVCSNCHRERTHRRLMASIESE